MYEEADRITANLRSNVSMDDYLQNEWMLWKNKKDRLDQIIERLRARKVVDVLSKLRQLQDN